MLRAKFSRLAHHSTCWCCQSCWPVCQRSLGAGEASTQDPVYGRQRLDEITVTAQKNASRICRMSAHPSRRFESAGLQRLGLHNVTDIAEQVPGLASFNQYGSTVHGL